MKKKFILIAILVAILFLFIIVLNETRRVEEHGEIGEFVGLLTFDVLNLENVEVRKGTDRSTLENSIGLYENQNLDSYNGNVCMLLNSENIYNLNNMRVGDLITYKTKNEESNYAIYEIDVYSENYTGFLKASNEEIITLVIPLNVHNKTNLIVQGYKLNR